MTALRTTTIAFSFAFLTTTSALAGPPLATDDAGTVEFGKVEVELNGAYTHDKETAFGVTTKRSRSDAELKITTGLYKDMGISLAIPYSINERVKEGNQPVGKSDGFGDMTIDIKYAFAELAGITFAIKPSVIMPTGEYCDGLSEGRLQFGTTLIGTREFAEGNYAVHANLGYEHHEYRSSEARESSRSNLWSGSIAGEAKVMQGLTAVLDFGLATTADKSTSQLSACVLTGARYEIDDHLDIHAGVKLGLTKPEDDVSILYGLALNF